MAEHHTLSQRSTFDRTLPRRLRPVYRPPSPLSPLLAKGDQKPPTGNNQQQNEEQQQEEESKKPPRYHCKTCMSPVAFVGDEITIG